MVPLLSWFAPNVWGNIVANGNFSLGTFTQTFGTATDILPVDWSLDPPNNASDSHINVITPLAGYADPNGSSNYIAFQSVSTNGQDCLDQTFSTVAGQTYTISFFAAMTASAVANTFLTAEWDSGGAHDTDLGGQLFSSSSGAATTGFLHFQFTEMASSNNTLFFFHGDQANGAILVADLSVDQASAPEPGSLLLVGAGFAAVGARVLRVKLNVARSDGLR